MSSSDSLTSSGKGGTDDNSDSNTSEDIPDKDENEASASKDDSGKTNAEDKPQSSLEKMVTIEIMLLCMIILKEGNG